MNVSEERRVIFEVSSRVSTKYTTWERLFAFVSWIEWYCYSLAVETADFFVALLSLWHTAQRFTPEYFNFQSTSFLLIIARLDKNNVEAWKVKWKLKWFIECILSKHNKFNSQISYTFRPNMVIIRLITGKKIFTQMYLFSDLSVLHMIAYNNYIHFDVLLTVHLSIFISVINQLVAQKFCFTISLFHALHVSSTCAHHHKVKIALHSLWYHHTYRCDDTSGCVIQFWPPDDEHMCSKHVEAWNKLIVK